MELNLRAKLAMLGLKQKDILPDIEKELILTVNEQELSLAINGKNSDQPKMKMIVEAANKILDKKLKAIMPEESKEESGEEKEEEHTYGDHPEHPSTQ